MDSSSSPFGVHCTGSEEDGDGIGRGKAEELSRDLIVEILVRLPVKTLLRFKSVSKLWYSLITSPNFIALHSTHTHRKKKLSLLFLRMVDLGPEATVSFQFDQFVEDLTIPYRESDVVIVGCFNGVVCLSVSYRPQRYVLWCPPRYALWNPATRQLREIRVPNGMAFPCLPGNRWSGNGFCFDPVANSFTVANITLTCAIGEEQETRAHIIQFSTATNSWTQKSMSVPFRIWETDKRHTLLCRSITCVNSGSLALIAEDDDAWVMNDCGDADQSWSKPVTCRRPSKVGPGVEVFIESNEELLLVRKPGETVLLELCYPYCESIASLY